jgi:pantoate--beta-alanine ligase
MKIIRKSSELHQFCKEIKIQNKKLGFVPTMGALHFGHLTLINRSIEECEITVLSIFINPTQFNEVSDFANYPRQETNDLKYIENINVDVVFIPSVNEMYDSINDLLEFNLEGLDTVMEGKWRPGHFKGVITIVEKLFSLVNPDNAYFGQKDFQQLCIIKKMSAVLHPKVLVVGCEIVREANGLAMSSRNALLSEEEKVNALVIFKTLNYLKENWHILNLSKNLENATSTFNKSKLHLEYLEIVDKDSLLPLSEFQKSNAIACIAAKCGKVRLIDNVIL